MFDNKELLEHIEDRFKRRDEREIEKLKSKQDLRKRFEGAIVYQCQLCGKYLNPQLEDFVDSVDEFLELIDEHDVNLSPRQHSCNDMYNGITGTAKFVGIVNRTRN